MSALDIYMSKDNSTWEEYDAARAELAQLEAAVAKARGLIVRSGNVINKLKGPDSAYDLLDDLSGWLDAYGAP